MRFHFPVMTVLQLDVSQVLVSLHRVSPKQLEHQHVMKVLTQKNPILVPAMQSNKAASV